MLLIPLLLLPLVVHHHHHRFRLYGDWSHRNMVMLLLLLLWHSSQLDIRFTVLGAFYPLMIPIPRSRRVIETRSHRVQHLLWRGRRRGRDRHRVSLPFSENRIEERTRRDFGLVVFFPTYSVKITFSVGFISRLCPIRSRLFKIRLGVVLDPFLPPI